MLARTGPRHIDNPVTGDRIDFLSSPLLGDGDQLVFRCTLAPQAKGSPLHFHRTISETFQVEQGLLEMEVDKAGAVQTLAPGEGVSIVPGRLHSFRNPLSEPTVFLSTATPGAQFEKFLRAMYGLAADGRTNVDGMPTDPRTLALVLRYADLAVPMIPLGVQTVLMGALIALARSARLDIALDRYWLDMAPAGNKQQGAA